MPRDPAAAATMAATSVIIWNAVSNLTLSAKRRKYNSIVFPWSSNLIVVSVDCRLLLKFSSFPSSQLHKRLGFRVYTEWTGFELELRGRSEGCSFGIYLKYLFVCKDDSNFWRAGCHLPIHRMEKRKHHKIGAVPKILFSCTFGTYRLQPWELTLELKNQ